MQLAQKISLLIMCRFKRSISDFPCSDEYKRTVSEGTRSCAKVMSLVIEDWKSPYDFIRSPRLEIGQRTWELTSDFFLVDIGGRDDI